MAGLEGRMNPEGGRSTYFSLEELAAKMQSLRMCERPRHMSGKMKCAFLQLYY